MSRAQTLQRTLKENRKMGRTCGIVERFIHNRNVGYRSDLFGIFDAIAMGNGGIIGLQACGSDFKAHLDKILLEKRENSLQWLRSRGKIELWGWRKVVKKRGGKAMVWAPRIKKITLEDFGMIYDVENNFTYHPPDSEKTLKYVGIRDRAKSLVEFLGDVCPPSRELSLARTKLEEVVMWANASIARNP